MATLARSTFQWQVSFTDFMSLVARDETLSDEQVINAIIGLLFGATCDKLVDRQPLPDNSLQLNSVRLPHVSSIASRSFLKQWLSYGEDMMKLLDMLYPEPGSSCDVLHDLSYTLTSYLHSLRAITHSVVVSNLSTHADEFLKFTGDKKLHSFIRFLDSKTALSMFHSVSLIGAIHSKIIDHPDFHSNHTCTAVILDVLFECLDVSLPNSRNLVWNMFLDALKPNLFFLERMLDMGSAYDPYDEFMYEVNGKCVNIDPTFWLDCVSLRSDEAVAKIFKPILAELTVGVKSRLLLSDCNIASQLNEEQQPLFDQFLQAFNHLQSPRPQEDASSLSDTPDDRSRTESFSEAHEVPSQNNCASDSGLDSPFEVANTNIGNLLDNDCLAFKNVTPMDIIYYSVDKCYSRIESLNNPDFEKPSDMNHELPYSLPDRLKMPLKLAIERSLYPLIRERVENASNDLMSVFKPHYLTHLTNYTDYWLMQKPTHSISLYLDSLFKRITLHPKDRMSMDTFHLDEAIDIRAVILHASPDNCNDTPKKCERIEPTKILERVELIYGTMDAFSCLLLNSNFKQIMSNAFHFLIQLKYAKWILEQINLRLQMLEQRKIVATSKKDYNSKHELFCLRFKCIGAIDSLIETIMFGLNESVTLLMDQSNKAHGFDDLRASLDRFNRSVRSYTFQDRKEKGKNVLINITLTSTKLFDLCQMPNFSWAACSDVSPVKIREKVDWISSIANLIGYRSTDFITI